jgi:protein-export membrane protein SecD
MRDRYLGWLIAVLIVIAVAITINVVNLEYQRPKGLTGEDRAQPVWAKLLFWQSSERRAIKLMQGLDLQGGLQVLLEADVPAGTPVASDDMEAALQVIRNRVDALGVTESLLQRSGDRRIVLELPGVSDPDLAIATVREQAFLEFVDAGYTDILEGAKIRTTITTGSEPSPTVPVTRSTDLTSTETLTASQRVYSTVLSGKELSSVRVTRSQLNEPEVAFTLNAAGASTFGQFTAANNEQTLGGRRYFLCIVLDKVVVSCPSIRSPIPDGQGVITLGGKATTEDAQKLAIQLRSGSLPISLRVVESRAIGPTLGQDSISKSILAGIIGIAVVLIFMLLYYRLPGVLADLALLTFAAISLAIYKAFPVTMTLPGIAGFLLSTGMAVDANVLIFERMKEELRAGRPLHAAVEAGFDRAWVAIRDSNLSTLITCVILFWFGSNFGASMVKGFAITLFLGVLTSMFTAVVVTHTFMRVVFRTFGEKLRNQHWLMGV